MVYTFMVLIREKQTDIEPNFGEKRSNCLLWPRKFAAAAVTSPLPLPRAIEEQKNDEQS